MSLMIMNNKKYNIGILGATGAVGQEMLLILKEKHFPINNLYLFASKSSVGKKIIFDNIEYIIKEIDKDLFTKIDIIFSALDNKLAKDIIPYAVKAGCLVIDNSSFYRLNKDVPLVIPEINPLDILKHKGIIANPNCSTIIALLAIYKLHQYAKVKSMIVSTYQAVSGAGSLGIEELDNQIIDILNNKKVKIDTFPYQIAYNLIPQIGDEDQLGYTNEEMKMQNETRKILNDYNIKVSCTCVRVPVYRSHSESINITFEQQITPTLAKTLLYNTLGLKLIDYINTKLYPMPILSNKEDYIYVVRIREDLTTEDNKSII